MIIENWSRNWKQREGDAVARMAALDSVGDEAAAGRAFHRRIFERKRLAMEVGSVEMRLKNTIEAQRKASVALDVTLTREVGTQFYGNRPSVVAALELAKATKDVKLLHGDLDTARAALAAFDSPEDAA